MATRGDVTVRIDKELREKARDLGINLSRLLEDALRNDINRREAITAALKHLETSSLGSMVRQFRLPMRADDGSEYDGVISGALLVSEGNFSVYLTGDERVLVYDVGEQTYREVGDPREGLRSVLGMDSYLKAMRSLGLKPLIDI